MHSRCCFISLLAILCLDFVYYILGIICSQIPCIGCYTIDSLQSIHLLVKVLISRLFEEMEVILNLGQVTTGAQLLLQSIYFNSLIWVS